MDDKECPLCLERGEKTFLKLCNLNFQTAVYMCPLEKCEYPYGHPWIYVQRNLIASDDESSSVSSESVERDIDGLVNSESDEEFRQEVEDVEDLLMQSQGSNVDILSVKAPNSALLRNLHDTFVEILGKDTKLSDRRERKRRTSERHSLFSYESDGDETIKQVSKCTQTNPQIDESTQTNILNDFIVSPKSFKSSFSQTDSPKKRSPDQSLNIDKKLDVIDRVKRNCVSIFEPVASTSKSPNKINKPLTRDERHKKSTKIDRVGTNHVFKVPNAIINNKKRKKCEEAIDIVSAAQVNVEDEEFPNIQEEFPLVTLLSPMSPDVEDVDEDPPKTSINLNKTTIDLITRSNSMSKNDNDDSGNESYIDSEDIYSPESFHSYKAQQNSPESSNDTVENESCFQTKSNEALISHPNTEKCIKENYSSADVHRNEFKKPIVTSNNVDSGKSIKDRKKKSVATNSLNKIRKSKGKKNKGKRLNELAKFKEMIEADNTVDKSREITKSFKRPVIVNTKNICGKTLGKINDTICLEIKSSQTPVPLPNTEKCKKENYLSADVHRNKIATKPIIASTNNVDANINVDHPLESRKINISNSFPLPNSEKCKKKNYSSADVHRNEIDTKQFTKPIIVPTNNVDANINDTICLEIKSSETLVPLPNTEKCKRENYSSADVHRNKIATKPIIASTNNVDANINVDHPLESRKINISNSFPLPNSEKCKKKNYSSADVHRNEIDTKQFTKPIIVPTNNVDANINVAHPLESRTINISNSISLPNAEKCKKENYSSADVPQIVTTQFTKPIIVPTNNIEANINVHPLESTKINIASKDKSLFSISISTVDINLNTENNGIEAAKKLANYLQTTNDTTVSKDLNRPKNIEVKTAINSPKTTSDVTESKSINPAENKLKTAVKLTEVRQANPDRLSNILNPLSKKTTNKEVETHHRSPTDKEDNKLSTRAYLSAIHEDEPPAMQTFKFESRNRKCPPSKRKLPKGVLEKTLLSARKVLQNRKPPEVTKPADCAQNRLAPPNNFSGFQFDAPTEVKSEVKPEVKSETVLPTENLQDDFSDFMNELENFDALGEPSGEVDSIIQSLIT